MRHFFFIAVALVGCEAESDSPAAQQVGTDMDVQADAEGAGGAEEDFGRADAAPAAGEARWIALIDNTQGLGIGNFFGADIDAVAFECPDGRRGFAADVAPEDAEETAALGAPDGPCDPPDGCSATLGASGTLLLRLDSGDLVGCTITVYEQADNPDDRFDVWTCAGPSFDACTGPWFGGRDGETVAGEVGG